MAGMTEMEQLLAQLKQAKEKGELTEENKKMLKELAGVKTQTQEIPDVGTLEAEATIRIFVVKEENGEKYWDEQYTNVGIISNEMASKILGISTNELMKKYTETKKAKEEARKKREDRKREPEEEEE